MAAARGKKRPVYATIDGRALQVGALYRNRKGIGLKDAAGTLDVAQGSFHVAGKLNGNPVGLCGSIAPMRLLAGTHERSGQDADGISVDANAMGCVEVGIGEHATLRDTVDLNTNPWKFVVVRNTLGADLVDGHLNVGWTYERETNLDTDESVSRNMIGVKAVY